ncbi:unnamed protein product [Parascedosporium putredinis]|uniref:Aminotransferase class I/classII large domain-containing protein n=1 Tax=Parascedosporium putredinis TaxID=1442378 RepID=A0A9P1H172_9PEZI|nr:unnamed protein product [Parascedosporium putredinis]CAI7994857.1 unnamed protein product [Parascedosporium putredinis]
MSLSARAETNAKRTGTALIWQIIQNLWEPTTNPLGYISLGVAENLLMHDDLLAHIHANTKATSQALTYGDGTGGSKRLRASMTRFLTKHLRPVEPIQSQHITVTNGCSSAIEHMSWAIANPGEGFLLGQPYYGTFKDDITLRTDAHLVPVPFHGIDPLGREAVAKYEEALLKSQENGVIIDLMKLCEKYGIHLISDEIYALSVWSDEPPAVPYESALSIPLAGVMDQARLHVLWGMSKDFGANGLRMGVIISQHNEALHTALVCVSLYSSTSSLSEIATANILDDDAWVESYIATNRKKLAANYAIARAWADENGVSYAKGVNAAFFLWVDLGAVYRTKHPDREVVNADKVVMDALLRNRVFLASGKAFGSEEPGWFRIVFSVNEEYLLEGLKRVLAALDE